MHARGRRLDASYVRRLLPRLAAKVGIDKRVHAHGLRHAHAAELVADGVPVNVQQHLGHGSLATTDRYLRHIAPREWVEAMRGPQRGAIAVPTQPGGSVRMSSSPRRSRPPGRLLSSARAVLKSPQGRRDSLSGGKPAKWVARLGVEVPRHVPSVLLPGGQEGTEAWLA